MDELHNRDIIWPVAGLLNSMVETFDKKQVYVWAPLWLHYLTSSRVMNKLHYSGNIWQVIGSLVEIRCAVNIWQGVGHWLGSFMAAIFDK